MSMATFCPYHKVTIFLIRIMHVYMFIASYNYSVLQKSYVCMHEIWDTIYSMIYKAAYVTGFWNTVPNYT